MNKYEETTRDIEKEYQDVKVGDIVICYDEYNHDYEEHRFCVESIEEDEEYVCEGNPKGKVLYGNDLTVTPEESDDYIGVVHSGNFVGIERNK